MKYRICKYCGDHLDFGEQCDCREGIKPIRFEKMIEEKPVLVRYGDVTKQKQPSYGVNIPRHMNAI